MTQTLSYNKLQQEIEQVSKLIQQKKQQIRSLQQVTQIPLKKWFGKNQKQQNDKKINIHKKELQDMQKKKRNLQDSYLSSLILLYKKQQNKDATILQQQDQGLIMWPFKKYKSAQQVEPSKQNQNFSSFQKKLQKCVPNCNKQLQTQIYNKKIYQQQYKILKQQNNSLKLKIKVLISQKQNLIQAYETKIQELLRKLSKIQEKNKKFQDQDKQKKQNYDEACQQLKTMKEKEKINQKLMKKMFEKHVEIQRKYQQLKNKNEMNEKKVQQTQQQLKQYHSIKKQIQIQYEQNIGICKICIDQPAIFANNKCGHVTICKNCMKKYQQFQKEQVSCPLCCSKGQFIQLFSSKLRSKNNIPCLLSSG